MLICISYVLFTFQFCSGASSVDEEQLLCIVRDFCNPAVLGTGGKHTLNLKSSIMAQQAATDIARSCGYKEKSVSVHYEQEPGGNNDVRIYSFSVILIVIKFI